jgi:hypothetical protein
MSKTMSYGLLCRLAVVGAVLSGLTGLAGVANASQVGVAAAVNPDAFSSLNGAPQSQLNIGKSIFYNERINTTGSGLVQVLLVDGSTFTVGPGSDLVIDKFVYNPNKKSGEIAASLTKGVMRFVGGKISKNADSVTVDTPAGALAIRGGMFDLRVNGTKLVAVFTYGVELKLTHNGVETVAFQPGWVIDTTTGSTTVRQATPADTNSFQAALTNKSGGSGSGAAPGGTTGEGPKPGSKYTEVQTLSLQDLIADATTDQINGDLDKQEEAADDTTGKPPTETADNPPPVDTTGNPPPTDTENPPPPPPPVTVDVRVLTPPGVYTAFPNTSDEFTTDNPESSGILGGDARPDVNADDFNQTLTFEGGRLKGTVSGLNDGSGSFAPATIDLPSVLQCLTGVCAVSDGTITQGGHTTNYTGIAIFEQGGGFYAYDLVSDSIGSSEEGDRGPDLLLAFGGKGYNFGTPSGKTYAFVLTPDLKESIQGGAIGPFAGANSSPDVNPNGPQPSVSPLLYLEKDSAAANDQAARCGSRPASTSTRRRRMGIRISISSPG